LKADYNVWNNFKGTEIPSSLDLYDIIFDFLKKSDVILDIGCGFGKTCFYLFEKGYTNITGIDINQTGIDYATNYGKIINCLPRPIFSNGDATTLSYQNNMFDFIIMQAFLTAIPKKEDRIKIFDEGNRVLKKNGGLYIAEFCQTWHSPLYRQRYLEGMKITGEKGSFPAYNNETGELEYFAHHFSEEEIVEPFRRVQVTL
jgi:ubiquinone/menaquinone biosynthesis C-methylase UbiE